MSSSVGEPHPGGIATEPEPQTDISDTNDLTPLSLKKPTASPSSNPFAEAEKETTAKVSAEAVLAAQQARVQISATGYPTPVPTRPATSAKVSASEAAFNAGAFTTAMGTLTPAMRERVTIAMQKAQMRATSLGVPPEFASNYLRHTLASNVDRGFLDELVTELALPNYGDRIATEFKKRPE